jgi:type IV secretion system protein VirB4
MLHLLKKKQEISVTGGEADTRDLSAYVPYYSHFNDHTLLTKNGEVMQIIRIRCNNAGLNYESGESEEDNVREHIRTAIANAITTDDYALWIHTIRRRKKVQYSSTVADPFASYVNTEWQKTHPWKFQYYNEIYISILHNGQSGELLDKRMRARTFNPKSNRVLRNEFLDQTAATLETVTSSILTHIRAHYRAERLSVVERRGTYYSEPMEFLGKILNLRTEPFPVHECDISRDLTSHTLMFGFNALEAKDAEGHRCFGAVLSLKQYRELPPAAADRLLQAPVECIVSQAFSFTSAKRALKEYRMQKGIFQVSGDNYSSNASGLEEMLAGDRGLPTDFGTLQTTVMVIVDEYRQIDEQVNRVQTAFGEMGLIAVREDIKLEECFWSQLPGNFDFIRRKDTVITNHVAGFARLNLFPDGKDANNHWGTAVALIPTHVNSPYFFNFHQHDNGHTVLFDFNAFRDDMGRILANFLLTSAVKYRGRIIVFDRGHGSHLLFDKLKGAYHRLQAGKKTATGLRLNPFSLEDNKRNRGFLLAWVSELIGTNASTDSARAALESAIDRLYTEPAAHRNLTNFIPLLTDTPELTDALRLFTAAGKYAGIFDAENESLDLAQSFNAFNMDDAVKQGRYLVPLFAYLMHRIVLALDGKPTIIVLHEAFSLLENSFFASRLESLMDMLTQNNTLLFATMQKPESCVDKSTFAILTTKAATQIILPDDITQDYASLLPTLNEHDNQLMTEMDRTRGDFLVKQSKESISLRANLDDMEAARSIFANDVKTLIAAGGPFATLPKESLT